MEPLDVAQAFIEHAHQAQSAETLIGCLQDSLLQLGFRYFACCSHVSPEQRPPGSIFVHNYPQEWVHEVLERRLYEIDPILRHAEQTSAPFFWDAVELQRRLTPDQRAILRRAASIGLSEGYTVPIHRPWGTPPASCSVVPGSVRLNRRNFLVVAPMAAHLYQSLLNRQTNAISMEAVNTSTVLTRRQCQCLELAAEGKSDWEISRILRISEGTVHKHIENVRTRLGVATRVQAIVLALRTGKIFIRDLADASTLCEYGQPTLGGTYVDFGNESWKLAVARLGCDSTRGRMG